MGKVTQASSRKSEHIQINLERDVDSGVTSGLEQFRFVHDALPELNLRELDTRIELFGKTLEAPLFISSMTGGTPEAGRINANLATAAQDQQIAMGVGSQRVALEDPQYQDTFNVRNLAPDILLFANIGAIQLNYSFDSDTCQRAVDMIEADALILHLNALQEALQPEGETEFRGLLARIESVCSRLKVPVIAKEVGWGFNSQTAKHLVDAGVAAIDIAGAGGTSWSQVEMYRSTSKAQAKLAAEFKDWGIPTAEAIVNLRATFPGLPILASGGLRTGMDAAKCIALGASAAGMASPFLKAAVESPEAVIEIISHMQQTIQITMFATGSPTLGDLASAVERFD